MTSLGTAPQAGRRPRSKAVRELLLLWPSLAVIGLVVLMAILAPQVAPYPPNEQNLLARLRPPGTEVLGNTYLLGTDQLGRDLLSRIIYGARVSLLVAVLSVMVSLTIGSVVGMVAGYLGGWVDGVLMRLVDIVLSIPALLLAIITVAVLGPGLQNLVLILGFTRWPRYARVAYGQTLSVKALPFVEAELALGAKTARILFRHIAPNILGPLLVVATLEFGLMVLFEAGLSFLGLGVQPPTPSWGSILSVGREYVATAWWIATFPGLSLFLMVLGVNIIGDYLPDRLDPRSKQD
jgi:peptide/nickel transport system permease protein